MSSAKEINKFFEKMDDEDFVNGYLIKLPNSHPCCYDELWLLDVNDETGLAPILIEDINGSSIHALWCCNFDNCCEEEDAWDLETLVRMVGEGWSWWRKGLLKVMEAEERAKRPPTEEAEDEEPKLICQYCKRNEEECEEQTDNEKNPITEWCGGWGLSCDDCYYENHPESDSEEEDEEDQDNFTERICENDDCRKEFHTYEPHYYDEEEGVCYCCVDCKV